MDHPDLTQFTAEQLVALPAGTAFSLRGRSSYRLVKGTDDRWVLVDHGTDPEPWTSDELVRQVRQSSPGLVRYWRLEAPPPASSPAQP